MKTVYHAADTRGDANHGWLKSKHTFSFANYYHPERMGFGALRVINDDHVEGGKGFGTHPHRDMEIISIPLSGKLNHGDSMGNQGIIEQGDIQVMSAGTGVVHSEMNGDNDEPVQFLQIWVQPNAMSVAPRYQQLPLSNLLTPNQFNQILSPNQDDAGVWIHQDAWFNMGEFDADKQVTYQLHHTNHSNATRSHGVYVFVIEGKISVNAQGQEEQVLTKRDGLGVWDVDSIDIQTLEKSTVLLMEVPM